MKEFQLPQNALLPFECGDSSMQITKSLLDQFLADTCYLEIPASERLRWLAINLEHESFSDGWVSLKRIYELSIQHNPKDMLIFRSAVLSSLEWINSHRTKHLADRLQIFSTSEQWIVQARAIGEEDADLAYLQGLLLYNHPESEGQHVRRHLDQSLKHLTTALRLDKDHQMAALYRAHCFQDTAQWQKAFDAYSKIDPIKFIADNPDWKWRMIKLQEQRAFCCANTGDIDSAEALLLNFVTAIESLSPDELEDQVVNLDESVNLLTTMITDKPELLNRLKNIAKKIDIEKWYDWGLPP